MYPVSLEESTRPRNPSRKRFRRERREDKDKKDDTKPEMQQNTGKKQQRVTEGCSQGRTVKLLKRIGSTSSGGASCHTGPGCGVRQL